MKILVTLCIVIFTLGCDGKSPTADKTSAETEANESTDKTRLSSSGESCARAADCEQGLRCKSQTCVDPKASENAEKQYMAMMEGMCKCSKSQDSVRCMQTIMGDIQALFAANKGLAENKQLQAMAETRMAACLVNKKPGSEDLATAKTDEKTEEASKDGASEATKPAEDSLKPTEEKKEEKAEAKKAEAIGATKQGTLAEMKPPEKGGIGPIPGPSSKGSTVNALAVAFAGKGDELKIGHGSGGMGVPYLGGGSGDGRIGGTRRFDTGGGHGSRGLGKRSTKRRAMLKMSSGSTRGFCSKSDIASKVRRRAGAIRNCYEKQLMRNPKLAGKVTARWTIGIDGRIKGRVTASGLGAVAKCIARKLQVIRFKKPESGICAVQWPFVFKSGK